MWNPDGPNTQGQFSSAISRDKPVFDSFVKLVWEEGEDEDESFTEDVVLQCFSFVQGSNKYRVFNEMLRCPPMSLSNSLGAVLPGDFPPVA